MNISSATTLPQKIQPRMKTDPRNNPDFLLMRHGRHPHPKQHNVSDEEPENEPPNKIFVGTGTGKGTHVVRMEPSVGSETPSEHEVVVVIVFEVASPDAIAVDGVGGSAAEEKTGGAAGHAG